jgi:phosphopantothenate synthetase
MRRFTFIFFGIALVIFLAYSFKPVTSVNSDDCVLISGKIVSIEEGTSNDIQIRLENDSHYYYINRGLEKGVNLKQLSSKVLNKTVTLYCPNRWTIVSPDGIVPHISRMEKGTSVVYSEF